MAEIKKIFCGDFVDQARKLEETADGRGNKLFDRLEVAEHMGFENVDLFERKLRRARTMYRESLQKKVRAMNEEGLTTDQISDQTGMNTDTIDILLDREFDDNTDYINELRDKRKKADEEFRESMNKNIEEMNKLFGNNSPLGSFRW